MKFDTIIIGGGLSGLICGIKLVKGGQNVAVIAGGQSRLLFNSGSFELLGYDNEGREVDNPVEAIAGLATTHPYKKVKSIADNAEEAKSILIEAGIKLKGDARKNHYRVTPLGIAKPVWLTVDDYMTLEKPEFTSRKKIAIVNIKGYLDFPTKIIAAELDKLGAECETKTFTTSELDMARRSPSEMRATNIAKVLSDDKAIELAAIGINAVIDDADIVILPVVLGIDDNEKNTHLKQLVHKPVEFVATLPPSVSGIRIQSLLRRYFTNLGGSYFLGDIVKSGVMKNGEVKNITTTNLDGENLVAENYVIATGSFMSHGLVADHNKVYEPVFGLDVDSMPSRKDWYKEYVYDAQPYMQFGVKTDDKLHALKQGNAIENLFAVGSVLSGNNPLKQADGSGVSMLTAIEASRIILGKE